MRVSTDTEVCVGCGQCALAVPEVFDQNQETGTVLLRQEWPPGQLHHRVREAARNCPVEAISVFELETARVPDRGD